MRAVNPQRALTLALILLFALAPQICAWLDRPFYLDLISRAMILALAATSLNWIMGYGGMISLGHAAYLGIGAYCVGIPAHYGEYDGLVQLGLCVGASALFALVTGALSLRTRGVYFIMITLAFAQMLYFTLVSLETYGGDDGLVIDARSRLPFLDLQNAATLYYVIFATLLSALFFSHRLVHSRFGRVLIGCKHNERRMRALGFNAYLYKLAAYVIAGAVCGLAGFLLGNFTDFISPEMIDWTHSGELIFMVVLGGGATLTGPLLGAAVFVFLEQWLSGLTIYWHFIFGALVIVLVLFGQGGVHGLIRKLANKP